MRIITNTEDLEKFCYEISGNNFITIDTEFSRETTYYPKLCLIQIAGCDSVTIIDALSQDINLSILDKVLQNPNIVKVFHSAKQDLEILYQLYNHLPKNIFDTQIAASFCGFGGSISYETLVLELVNIQIDKSHRVSDWTKRPLSDEQIEYAFGDVTHLREVYLTLIKSLKENKRLAWAIEEMDSLNSPNNFIIDVDQVWHKIKNIREVKVNLILKKLASWREIKAQQANLPRNHYLNEKYLFKLVENMPITLEEIKRISYFSNIEDNISNEILDLIRNALNQQLEEDLSNKEYITNYSNTLPQLKLLLKFKAKKYHLPPQLLATSLELKNFSNDDKNLSTIRFFNGWRYEIFGKFAIDIKKGNISVKEETDEVVIINNNIT